MLIFKWELYLLVVSQVLYRIPLKLFRISSNKIHFCKVLSHKKYKKFESFIQRISVCMLFGMVLRSMVEIKSASVVLCDKEM